MFQNKEEQNNRNDSDDDFVFLESVYFSKDKPITDETLENKNDEIDNNVNVNPNSEDNANDNKTSNEKEQKQHEPLKDYFELTEIEKKGKSYISSTFTSYNISIAFASNYNHENISPLNLEIKDYSSPKLLCDRRYDNFSSLYNYLIKEFPDSIYPKLSEKNYLSFFGSSAVFLNRRLKQLKFLLNYLLNYEGISSSKGFIKFLKDPEFDNEFFKNPTKKYEYPETEKFYSLNLMNKVSSLNLFSSTNQEETKYQRTLKEMKTYFTNLSNNINSLFQALQTLVFSLTEESENYNNIGTKLQNLFSNENIIRYQNIQKLCETNSKLIECQKTISLEKAIQLLDNFDEINLIVKGICCVFERHKELVNQKSKVKIAYLNLQKDQNKQGINEAKIKNEITKSENDQIQFEEKIIKEINDIWNKYKFNFVTCVIELGNIMVYLNKEELLILKNYF
jgi:hypothetical protein